MSRSKTNYSQTIETFLNFLKNCESENHIAIENLSSCEKEQQNLLHELELNDLNYNGRAKVATQISRMRHHRRNSKDTIELTKEIMNFCNEQKPAIKKLERILGEIRKYENFMETRTYKRR